MSYVNDMNYVNDMSYVDNMGYVNNMSYKKDYELKHELCKLYYYFLNHLKSNNFFCNI